MHTADDVLREWFSDSERWFRKDRRFDEHLRRTYANDIAAAVRGELDSWAATPRGTLALVILLDQFSRNVHRDAPEMFAGDEKALDLCLGAMESGADATLDGDERLFLYMPLMHSEDRAIQERAVEAFRALGKSVDWAQQHAEIVFRFGRFPHRNAILGRESTPEESRS